MMVIQMTFNENFMELKYYNFLEFQKQLKNCNTYYFWENLPPDTPFQKMKVYCQTLFLNLPHTFLSVLE